MNFGMRGARRGAVSKSVIFGTLLLSGAAWAGDNAALYSPAPLASTMPAVDGPNAKVEGFGGSLANRSIAGAQGAFTVPLIAPLGLQIDGAIGSFDGSRFGNVGGHLFWRDPGLALFGLYTSHTWWDRYGGAYVGQMAGEGEIYYGRFTLQGIAGVEFGNSASNTVSSRSLTPPGPIQFPIGNYTPGVITNSAATDAYNVRTRFFDEINLKYYIADNFSGYVGHRYLGGKNALALGSEYAFGLGRGLMASAFVEGRVGEGSFNGVWGGLKFYFGGHDKPLMARHRQDDPNVWGPDSLFGITNSHSGSSSSSSSTFCRSADDFFDGTTCFAPM